MYMSLGETWRTAPVAASTMASRCSKICDSRTPVCGREGVERSDGPGQILGEEDGDSFAVGRPTRVGEQPFQVRQLLGGRAIGGGSVELKLAVLFVIGEECNLFAIGRPGDGVLVVNGLAVSGSDARLGGRTGRPNKVDCRFPCPGLRFDIRDDAATGRDRRFQKSLRI